MLHRDRIIFETVKLKNAAYVLRYCSSVKIAAVCGQNMLV